MITVVGSLNLDLVVRVARLPDAGETLLASDYREYHGGKGANQALAAARAGGTVAMVGRVGRDGAGEMLRDGLARAGVAVNDVTTADAPSGRALIEVDDAGANRIVVVPGANAYWGAHDLPLELLRRSSLVAIQREIPSRVVEAAIECARGAGVPVMVNAAPAEGFVLESLGPSDVLIVNEGEAALLSGAAEPSKHAVGASEALKAARSLARRGPGAVIITLGADGAVQAGRSGEWHVAGFEVEPIDTTGAGDAFVGSWAVARVEGRDARSALRFACAAGAEAVTSAGAQSSLPTRSAIEARLSAAR